METESTFPKTTATAPTSRQAGYRLPWLILIVFISNVCMMVLGLVAGRIIATDRPLDLAAFKAIDAGDGETLFANQVLSQAETAGILAEGHVVLLTDRYAPVDQMLAPVARGEEARVDTSEPRDESPARQFPGPQSTAVPQ